MSYAPRGEPARLRSSHANRQFLFNVAISYTVRRADDRAYLAEIEGYAFDILDAEGREILAYHWHPLGISHVRRPHLHLSGKLSALEIGRGASPLRLSDMHLRTGHVTLEDIVELLIGEFDVRPLTEDWQTVLDY